jgi:hypothetical protein
MRKLVALALAVLALALVTTPVYAQVNNASITATATVQAPINVTAVSNLDFLAVFPGVAKTVLPTDATAGRWDVLGAFNAPVSLNFTLPTSLASGANLMPIGTWSGNHNTTATPAGTSFTPSGTPTAATLSATGNLFVYIGATVTPLANQAAGVYTAAVTLTVLY